MKKILVAGIGTDVGKTIVSTILTSKLNGDYWKPVQTGSGQSDSSLVRQLLSQDLNRIYPEAVSLKEPLSPYQAAKNEGITINVDTIVPPQSARTLIIEGVGGLLVPITKNITALDLFLRWDCHWIVVSRHYLGSINHTLLTLAELQRRNAKILGIIFNGSEQKEIEDLIVEISKVPSLGNLFPEEKIDSNTIKKYASKWSVTL